jgi:Prolyl oligopeptidase family
LDKLSGGAAFREELTKLLNYERFGMPTWEGGCYLYSKNSGLQNQSVFFKLKSLSIGNRLFVLTDLNAAKYRILEIGLNEFQPGALETSHSGVKALVAAKDANKIAIERESNGGLLIGAVLRQRADLFGVAVSKVGVLDAEKRQANKSCEFQPAFVAHARSLGAVSGSDNSPMDRPSAEFGS